MDAGDADLEEVVLALDDSELVLVVASVEGVAPAGLDGERVLAQASVEEVVVALDDGERVLVVAAGDPGWKRETLTLRRL